MKILYKDLIKNKAVIYDLLRGQDPMTKKDLPKDSFIKKQALIKQLKQIKDILNLVSKETKEISRWVNIDRTILKNIKLEEDVTLNKFVQKLKGYYKIDITYNMVAKLLEKEGYYEKNPEKKPAFIASDKGLCNGMKNVINHRTKSEDNMVILDVYAQKIVLELISKKVVLEKNYWNEKGYFEQN